MGFKPYKGYDNDKHFVDNLGKVHEVIKNEYGSYKLSLSAWFNLVLASITFPNTPLFKPAGANHSAAILSD